MTPTHLQQWIQHPETLNRDTLYELRNQLARYPYFQSLRLLYLKNLYIRVKPPEGDITVSAPTGITMDEVKLFVLGKLQEITEVRDRMLSQERQSKREYVSGE